jgi:hypothetical protein
MEMVVISWFYSAPLGEENMKEIERKGRKSKVEEEGFPGGWTEQTKRKQNSFARR